jgi:S1-C subfamily serine protease
MRPIIALLLAAALLPTATVAAAAAADTDRAAARAELAQLNTELARIGRAYRLVHEIVAPSVVAVHTKERIATRTWSRYEVREVEVGEGSGFVVFSDAEASWILTNAHVVVQTDRDQTFLRRDNKPVGYDRVRVTLNDNREFDAAYVGIDTQADLALLKIPVPRLPAVEWADSDQVHVGDFVVALGYPFGVGYSATYGNVSATDRSTGVYESNAGFESFIQTDAAINPGNSGGPLVTLDARIVGVNANIVSRSGGSVGLGFAIPSNFARRVAEDLRVHGRVQRGMVGVQMEELSAEEAKAAGLAEKATVRIAQVIPLSPAATAGLKTGDVILTIGDLPVLNRQQFRSRIAVVRPGETVRLRLLREGREEVVSLSPIATEDMERRLAAAAEQGGRGRDVALGQLGLRLGDDDQEGLVVTAVEPGSVADRAGLQRGDRVVGERTLGGFADLSDARRLAQAKEATLLVTRQDGRSFWVRLVRR